MSPSATVVSPQSWNALARVSAIRGILRVGAIALGGALLMSACGGSDYEGTATKVIEGELADTVGLGPVKATCDKPASGVEPIDGDTFACSATTESGETITYTATAAGDQVNVVTTNVILGTNMPEVERITAESLAQQIGIELPAESVDCGETSVIVSESTVMTCGLIDPTTNDVYDTELSNLDITGADGKVTFDIAVAEHPR